MDFPKAVEFTMANRDCADLLALCDGREEGRERKASSSKAGMGPEITRG